MTAQQQPQEQSQEQVQNEPQQEIQDRGEVPNSRQAIWSRIKGWSRTKKILVGITALFLTFVCAVAITPTDDGATTNESLDPPKVLVELIADHSKGEIHEGHWNNADKECRDNYWNSPEFTEERFTEVIDSARESSSRHGLLMPNNFELANLKTVYDGTLASSDAWAETFFTNRKVSSIFLKSVDRITLKKFGAYRKDNGTGPTYWSEWRENDDGSPEWAIARSHWDNSKALWHWFYCGTAKVN